MDIYTIGHYNHSKEQFLELLAAADVQYVADVRAFPKSRKSPQYKEENLQDWLVEAGISYRHFPKLGGRRSISDETGEGLNAGWRNRSFHNYADYTLTEEFHAGLEELKEQARSRNLAYMCSERHPARCHRLLISNVLEVNDWEVHHIIDGKKGKPEIVRHELGKWGAVPIIEEDGTVVYPKVEGGE